MQGEQGHEKDRKKRKKQRHIQKKIFQKPKKLLTTLPGNPCGQLNAIPEGKAGHVRTGVRAGTPLLVPFGPGGIAQQEWPQQSSCMSRPGVIMSVRGENNRLVPGRI